VERLRNGLMGSMGIIIRLKRGILGRISESGLWPKAIRPFLDEDRPIGRLVLLIGR